MSEITDWLDQAQARADAATDGEWIFEHDKVIGDGLYYLPSRVWTYGGIDPFGEANNDYVLSRDVTNEDAEFIAAARTDLPAAIAALRAVLDLHRPLNDLGNPPCTVCLGEDVDGEAVLVLYPCPTVRVIAEALGVSDE